jgi:hypothetical protein
MNEKLKIQQQQEQEEVDLHLQSAGFRQGVIAPVPSAGSVTSSLA